ncbi:unnamed protein product [Moneuplotes crassus]|uniref:AAA+ ATPase domain-containing protein n=1 Tax=Euplotes crassus TaxID=5936 RepID=A0AAD1UG22_EUPCR|nr:unnamed protein product [Moneuplotes crassus]
MNLKQNSQVLVKLLEQQESFKEKLRIAKRAIQVRDNQIHTMQSQVGVVPLDMTQSRLHLAFLFSSPLIRNINGKFENIMQLDYLTEIQDIVRVCNKMQYEMKYKSEVATVNNFRSVITDGPIALYFSGHGIQNTKANIGVEYYLSSDKGNILLLEDEQGMSHYLYEQDLKSMIKMANTQLEVVFVSSCHSQFAGEVFLNSGAKHVVCIRQGDKISDKTSLRFSKVFYETLFVKNYNVCTSFQIAKDEIRKVFNSTEANKFLLLTQQSKSGSQLEDDKHHKCHALANFKQGTLVSMNEQTMFESHPSNVEGFLGRQREMYEIIKHITENRLVTILGPAGIGKTSLARNLANYVKDRHKFSDGIIYVGLRECKSAHEFMTRLYLTIRQSCSLQDVQKYDLNSFDRDLTTTRKLKATLTEAQEGKYRNFILNILKHREVLLILDNVEDPLDSDYSAFISELESIIDNCNILRVLVTSRQTLNRLSFHHEKPYNLFELSQESALKLLISKAPRDIKRQEIQELLACNMPNSGKVKKGFNFLQALNTVAPRTLLDHPFTLLLGGHPQAISLAAPLLKYKTLRELFLDFCNSNMMDALEVASGH